MARGVRFPAAMPIPDRTFGELAERVREAGDAARADAAAATAAARAQRALAQEAVARARGIRDAVRRARALASENSSRGTRPRAE